jgi:hypothetical protein
MRRYAHCLTRDGTIGFTTTTIAPRKRASRIWSFRGSAARVAVDKPGPRDEALEILRKVTREFDRKNNTNTTPDVEGEISRLFAPRLP